MRRSLIFVVLLGCGSSPEVDPCAGLDLQTDAQNCGACGHDCLGGACQAGSCQPVVLAAHQDSPRRLVVDGDSVYWTIGPSGQGTESGSVRRAALDGSGLQTLVDRLFVPVAIAVDDQNVYFENGDCTINAVPKGGGQAMQLTDQQCVREMVVKNGALFWTGLAPGGSAYGFVALMDVGGGDVAYLAPDELGATGLAVTDSAVYFTDAYYGYPGLIRIVVLSEGSPATVATLDGATPTGIAVLGGRVYWTDALDPGGSLSALRPPDGQPESLAAMRLPLGLAADADTLYVAAHDDNQVVAVPVGGAARTLATDQLGVEAVAVDDKAIYWVNDSSDGAVMKLAK